MKDLTHYKLLAEMFRYPSGDLKAFSGKWRDVIRAYDPSLLLKLEPFLLHISEKPLSFQQEYYISTFDVQAECPLDIGFVLFGEDYMRGAFLVNIKKEQLRAGNDCGSELPDHLPNILTLLPKIDDPELVEELVYSLLVPAVNEMVAKFRDDENVYRGLLEILVTIMERDYPVSSYERFNIRHMKRSMVDNITSGGKSIPDNNNY